MTVTTSNPEILSELDRPNSYIGKSVPRPNLDRLMQGRGLYVSDLELPRTWVTGLRLELDASRGAGLLRLATAGILLPVGMVALAAGTFNPFLYFQF